MISRHLPLLLLALMLPLARGAEIFVPDMAANATRPWPGKDFWANPAEDWQLEKGRFENTFSGGNRSIVLLTAELAPKPSSFTLRTNVEQVSYELFGEGYVGFQVGLKSRSGDFREAAIAGSGFAAGVDFRGQPFIGQVKGDGPPLPLPLRGLVIELKGEPVGAGSYDLSLLVQDETGKILGSARTKADASWLSGLIAVTASTQAPTTTALATARPANLPVPAQAREGEGRFAFSKLELVGDKFERHPERAFGPILWTTYTFDNDGTSASWRRQPPSPATRSSMRNCACPAANRCRPLWIRFRAVPASACSSSIPRRTTLTKCCSPATPTRARYAQRRRAAR
ncbi:hypothetical protein [Haloferula sp. BvORR071]|uniref:hypothetical protein n=1 Tax=Haloferula sp. BvORR071 TaxID=1396141 RepID=UPI00054F6112|nr:hypothetical protein [Haloferula sp. BvORR071]